MAKKKNLSLMLQIHLKKVKIDFEFSLIFIGKQNDYSGRIRKTF